MNAMPTTGIFFLLVLCHTSFSTLVNVTGNGGCDCNIFGVPDMSNPTCESGVCKCRSGMAKGSWPDTAGEECNPYFVTGRLYFEYGARFGNKLITMEGGFLDHAEWVSLSLERDGTYYELRANKSRPHSNDTFFSFITPPLDTTTGNGTLLVANATDTLVGVPFTVSLWFTTPDGDDWEIKDPSINFTYRPDPIISSIQPAKTFLRGGIYQTVVGENFDTLHLAFLHIDAIFQGIHYNLEVDRARAAEHVCDIVNSTLMLCQTPWIEQDQLDADPTSKFFNSKFRQFNIRMDLDGHDIIPNLPHPEDPDSTIAMYRNPELTTGDDSIHPNPYLSHKDKTTISISGQSLDFAAELKDYNVTVGDSECEVTSLGTNNVVCKPPHDKPPLGEHHKDNQPRVLVRVGFLDLHVGHLEYCDNLLCEPVDKTSGRKGIRVGTVIIIAVCAGVGLIIILILIGCLVRYFKNKFKITKELKEQIRILLLPSLEENANPRYSTSPRGALQKLDDEELKNKVIACLIPHERLIQGREVGSGQFGKVFVGQLRSSDSNGPSTQVAVKTIKSGAQKAENFRSFIEEAVLMKDFNHPNILSLLGIVLQGEQAFVVLPYMKHGDLKRYLKSEDTKCVVKGLIWLGCQVASGMAYMEEKGFVHRDLAARNCLVNGDEMVKVSDFGLSRNMDEGDYYRMESRNQPLPVRWMAYESLATYVFTSKSDVWSFGIVLWEIITRGDKPYGGMENVYIQSHIKQGHRLEKPEFCPTGLYNIMCDCWRNNPAERPTFRQLVKALQQFLTQGSGNPNNGYVPPEFDSGGYLRSHSIQEDYIGLIDNKVPTPQARLHQKEGPNYADSNRNPGIYANGGRTDDGYLRSHPSPKHSSQTQNSDPDYIDPVQPHTGNGHNNYYNNAHRATRPEDIEMREKNAYQYYP